MNKEQGLKYANVDRNCDYCGTGYKTYKSKHSEPSRFCSHKCYGLNKRQAVFIKNGYKLVYREGHPRADSRGRVREHLLVMEEKIGRPVLKSESVHHIDGNKLNNHPDNLGLFATHSDHLRHEWANGTLRKTRLGKHHPSCKVVPSEAELHAGLN